MTGNPWIMHFWRLVTPSHFESIITADHHNHLIMLAAVCLAVLAAWVLLPVVDRYNALDSRLRHFWLGAGSLAMGMGIWGMHFTSMLAVQLPFAIAYDSLITSLSIVPAIIASASCIVLYSAATHSRLRLHQASLCMAIGIGTMHYLGMEAVSVPAPMYYDPVYFLLSVAAAYVLALIGLYAKIWLGANPGLPAWLGLFAGSVILGLAVTCMHHIAMYATYFVPPETAAAGPAAHAMAHGAGESNGSPALIAGIVVSTVCLLGLLLLGMLVDRRMALMASSLKQSELRFKHLAETTPMAIFTFTAEHISYANPALSAITGYAQDELLDMPLHGVLGHRFRNLAGEILGKEIHPGEPFLGHFEIKTRTGDARWLYCSVTPAEFGDEVNCLASACDVSEQKKAELALRKLAYTDQLTELGNRAMFMDRLQHHLELLRRRKAPANSCVLLLDLDNFKIINDTYGHMIGDKLLRMTADRLRPLARKTDTIARLGGDEFVILLEEMDREANVNVIAERILNSLKQAVRIEERELSVHASIGIALLDPDTYASPDEVLHDVDIALYRAKEEGRCCWKLYDHEIDTRVKRVRQLKLELQEALLTGELQLHYQPIFCAAHHNLRGFEALARWQRKNGEWVSPAEFIPIAEEYGLVADLTLSVLDMACSQLAYWRESFNGADFYISINVVAESFQDEAFIRRVAENFQTFELAAGQLKLELTERMLVSDNKDLRRKLDTLIGLGCELMIDDFGTGYSSLSYLHRLPVTTLKIDRSFVADLVADKGSRSVVTSIIALAKALDLKVVSEGVETVEQLRSLTELGSDELQGYYLGRPGPAEAQDVLLYTLGDPNLCLFTPQAANFS